MPSVTVRRSIWALAAAIVLAGAVFAATPYIASTRIVRDRIAAEISAWSGFKVDIGAPPEIEVWPRLRTVLTNVTFSDRDAPSAGAVGKVERMEIELSPLAAMRGDAVFKAARLVRPSLILGNDANGGLLGVFAGKGRIGTAVERTRAALAENPQSPGLPAQPFGSVQVSEGQVFITRDGKTEPLVTNIDASLAWPAFDTAGSFAGRGAWRGETVSVDLRSAAPLMLLAGGTAPLRVSIESAPLSASFDGTAKVGGTPFLDGKASFSAVSLERLAGWTGVDLGGWQALRSIALSATVLGDPRRLKLDQAELQLDGDRAHGAVELNFAKPAPSISGSLAFERLKLDGLLKALMPLAAGAAEEELRRVLLDLRLSAGLASLGGFDMSDAAATVKIEKDSATFDILDATAFEGELRGGLRMVRGANGTVTEVNATASGINGGAFGSAMGMTLMVPNGRGSVSLALKGDGSDFASILRTGEGHVSAHFGPGALLRFDLPAFMELYGKGGFFPLDQAADGSLEVDRVALDARMADGVVSIDKAEARFDGRILSASGLASYAGSGLSLTGSIDQAMPDGGGSESPEASFFVGGSWSAPFISASAPGGIPN